MSDIHYTLPTSIFFARCKKTASGYILTLGFRADCVLSTRVNTIPHIADLHEDALDAMSLFENGTVLRFGLTRDVPVINILQSILVSLGEERLPLLKKVSPPLGSPSLTGAKKDMNTAEESAENIREEHVAQEAKKQKAKKEPKLPKTKKEPKAPKEESKKRERIFSRKLVPHANAIVQARTQDKRSIGDIAKEYIVAPIDIRLLLKEHGIEGKTK